MPSFNRLSIPLARRAELRQRSAVTRHAVIEQILAVLQAELASLTQAAQGSYAAATDPDSRAENKYDTRTLEASYVARGQARRVAELQEAVQAFTALTVTAVAPATVVQLGSLVTLQATWGEEHVLLGPFAGGTEIRLEGRDIVVITPASALGQKLFGRTPGDTVLIRPEAPAHICRVV
jgi:transcription elongation GreA/GreB family factor